MIAVSSGQYPDGQAWGDSDVITKNKLNYIHASGLPGKKAPKTVAEAMKDAVIKIIDNLDI